jgi:hypothetical protein
MVVVQFNFNNASCRGRFLCLPCFSDDHRRIAPTNFSKTEPLLNVKIVGTLHPGLEVDEAGSSRILSRQNSASRSC